MTKFNLEKKAIVALLVSIWLIVALAMPVMGLPDDDDTEPSEPPVTQTQTEPPVTTDEPPVTTDEPPVTTDEPDVTTDKPTSTASYDDDDKTSYHSTTTSSDDDEDYDTRTSSRGGGSYDIGQDEDKTSIYYYDDDKDPASVSWGTIFSEPSAATSTVVKKNIANYSELMHRIIWLPITLAVLAVGTLIFINVKAAKLKKGK